MPLLHLIHPALVHFSVAFLVVGGLSEAWGLLRDHPRSERFGATLLLIGTLSLLPTIVSGYLAANSVSVGAPAKAVLDGHESNGLLVLGLFVGAHFWKGWSGGKLGPLQRKLYAVLLLIGVLLAAYSALLGGELVYGAGVGVAGIGG